MIFKALMFAKAAHTGQKRKYTNTEYILHPIRVASALMQYPEVTETMIVAALLHDVVEDTSFTLGQIRDLFGDGVATLVDELTNKSKNIDLPRNERKKMDRERLATCSKQAKVIKLLDRIDNINEMGGAEHDFKVKYSYESKLLAETIGCVEEDLKNILIEKAAKLYELPHRG